MRASLQAFTEYFAHEFMEELWYLQKLTRGDLSARTEDSAVVLEMISNIAQAVLSLAPVPGLPIAYMLSSELLKKGMDLAEKVYKKGSEAYEKAKKVYELVENVEGLHDKLTDEKDETKGLFQSPDGGPVDMESMRLLAELLARGVAQRYEHVITKRLNNSDPLKSLLPLARVGARRCFEYLQSNSFFLTDSKAEPLLKQRAQLLNSVSLGKLDKDKSWRERLSEKVTSLLPKFIRELQQASLPTFPAGVGYSKGKFTSEGVYLHSAWYDEAAYYEAKEGEYKTELSENKANLTYGYAYLESTDFDSRKPFNLTSVQVKGEAPNEARFYRPVTKNQIAAYLKNVQDAIKEGKASQSFHQYLHAENQFPKDCQAVCHEDLSGLSLAYGDFSKVDFSGAVISGDVTGTKFENAYLVGARFEKIFHQKDKPPVDFTGATVAFAHMAEAKIPFAKLNQANFSFANLHRAVLTGADHIGTIWYKTRLTEIDDRNLLQEQGQQIAKIQTALQQQEKRVLLIEQQQEKFAKELEEIEDSLAVAKKMDATQVEQIKELTVRLANVELLKLRHEMDIIRLDINQQEHGKQIKHLQERIDSYEEELKKLSKQVAALKTTPKVQDLLKIGKVKHLIRAGVMAQGAEFIVNGTPSKEMLATLLSAWAKSVGQAVDAANKLKSIEANSGDRPRQMEIKEVEEMVDADKIVKAGKMEVSESSSSAERPKEDPVAVRSDSSSSDSLNKILEEKLTSLKFCLNFSIERPTAEMLTIKLTKRQGAPGSIEKELKGLVVSLEQVISDAHLKDYKLDKNEKGKLKITATGEILDEIAALLETAVSSRVPKASAFRAALFFEDRQELQQAGVQDSELVAQCSIQ